VAATTLPDRVHRAPARIALASRMWRRGSEDAGDPMVGLSPRRTVVDQDDMQRPSVTHTRTGCKRWSTSSRETPFTWWWSSLRVRPMVVPTAKLVSKNSMARAPLRDRLRTLTQRSGLYWQSRLTYRTRLGGRELAAERPDAGAGSQSCRDIFTRSSPVMTTVTAHSQLEHRAPESVRSVDDGPPIDGA